VLASASGVQVAHAFAPVDLMRTLAGVSASQASFVETRTSTLLKEPMVVEGTLGWRRPDRLVREVKAPYRETSVIEGATMKLTGRDGTSRTVPVPDGAPRALVEALRATLAGDLAQLERHFAVTVGGSSAQWTLTLAPKDPALGALIGRVDFAGRGAAIERIEVLEAGGDRTLTTLQPIVR
jgi:outer membrane lipoprotein-sorting protein